MLTHNPISSLALFFKLFEEKYQQLQQNPGTNEWQAATDDYLVIVRSYSIKKSEDSDEPILSQLVNYYKQLMLVERWVQYIPLDTAIDLYKQLLNFLQEKNAATDLRQSVMVCFYDYANYLAHVDGRLEQQRALYQRLHDDYIHQNLQDMQFEHDCIYRLAQCHSAQTQYRLSAFYFAYALKLANVLNDSVAIHTTETALIQQEAYLLYHALCVQDVKWLQFRCNIAIRHNNLNACFVVYDELCRLGNYFWSCGNFKTAEACYEQLLTLLHTFPGQHRNPLTGTDYQDVYLEARAKIRARISIDDSAADLKLTQLQQRRQTLADKRNQAVTNLITEPVQTQWSQDLKSFIAGLCKETEIQLGAAPCQTWAILCLGSLARDEACLYSDLEFAIVWNTVSPYAREDDVEAYFRRFVSLLEIKVIVLGETNKIANFTLTGMMAGLKFDDGRNYPFSGDKLYFGNLEYYLNYLKPKNANFQNKSLEECGWEIDVNVKDVLDIYMLADAEYLYGDEALVTGLKEKIRILFADKQQIQSQFRYREILAYRLVPNAGFNLDILDKINIKEQLIHLPQRILASLALFYGITEGSTDKRIDALVSKNIIHPQLGNLLRIVLRFSFTLRMQAHEFLRSEQDDFYFGTFKETFSEEQAPVAEIIKCLLKDIYPVLMKLFESWKETVSETSATMFLQSASCAEKIALPLEALLHHFIEIFPMPHAKAINVGLYFMRGVLENFQKRKTSLSGPIIEKGLIWIGQRIKAVASLHIVEEKNQLLQFNQLIVMRLLHLADDETLEQGFLTTLQSNAQAAKKIIIDWVDCLLMLNIEESHLLDWYTFLFRQEDAQYLEWCEQFYRACMRLPHLEVICLAMVELADSTGFRLLERLNEKDLNDAIATLTAEPLKPSTTRTATLLRADRPPMQLHPEVVKQILDEQGHLRHNTGTRAKDAYPYRRIHRLQYHGTDIFFKEHPDFPIMAYGSYLVNMRLTGHGATLTELGWLEVEESIKEEVVSVSANPAEHDPGQFNNSYDRIAPGSHAILKKELLQFEFEPKQITDIEERHILKVLMLGPSGGGKSTLQIRMEHGYYKEQQATIGVNFTTQTVRDSNTEYMLQLWDISGQEHFENMKRAYFRGASIAVVAFDPSSRQTFEHNLQYLIGDVERHLGSVPIVLLKTKSDLKGKISDEEIQDFMLKNDIDAYCACSARTGEGIDEFRQILLRLAKQILFTRKHREKAIKYSRAHEKAPASEPEIKRLRYPVLISLAVPGKTLAEVLNTNEYRPNLLSTNYLSSCFLTEQIKHHGDALGQNFVLAKLKNRSHQLVCVDLEQMFVASATKEGFFFKTHKIQEVNILSCLPELQPGGVLFDQGLAPEVVAQFANLDINAILNRWSDDLALREQAYLRLVGDSQAEIINQERGAKHPYFHRMIFPRGVLRKLAHDLWIIKLLSTKAMTQNQPLYPKTIVEYCSGKKIAAAYFAPSLSKLSPQQRLQQICGRTVSQSNSEYQKFYVGERKSLVELAGSDYSIQQARHELKGFYLDERREIVGESRTLMTLQHFHITMINLTGLTVEEQKNILQGYHQTKRKIQKFHQLHLEGGTAIHDEEIELLLSSSKKSLQSLTLKTMQGLGDKTIVNLTKGFSLLTELVLHRVNFNTFRNGTSAISFNALRALYISYCDQMTSILLRALKLEHAEIKSNLKLVTIDITAPMLTFIAIEENLSIKHLSIKPKVPEAIKLIGISESCEFIPKDLLFKNTKFSFSKIILILVDFGYCGVGSLIRCYSGDEYGEHSLIVGVEFGVKLLKIDNQEIKLEIYEENSRNMNFSKSYKNEKCQGCMMVFDLTRRETYNRILIECESIEKSFGKIIHFPFVLLIGNKSDLENQREVSYEEGLALATELGCHYIETSALDGTNVDEAFRFLTESIYHKFVLGNDEPLPLPDYIKRPPYYPVPSQAQLLTQFSSIVSAPKHEVVEGLSKQNEQKPEGDNASLRPQQ